MTFNYGYRDSSNARLTGVIVAPSRDEAYRLLKEKGVRPTFVTPAPGLKNKIQSLGKRGWSVIVLGALCLVLGAAALEISRRARASRAQQQAESSSPLTRRQIYGDPALMEELQLENYASLFAEEGDRVLAHFAQPALQSRFVQKLRRDPIARAKATEALAALVDASPRGRISPKCADSPRGRISPKCADSPRGRISPKCAASVNANFSSRQGQDVGRKTSDVGGDKRQETLASRERSELVRIVRWMRDEMTAYLAVGTGTPATYLARLLERQAYEAQLYTRAKRELEGEKDPAVYEQRNAELRAIGAPTIRLPTPEEE